jgi:hypothetical protein
MHGPPRSSDRALQRQRRRTLARWAAAIVLGLADFAALTGASHPQSIEPPAGMTGTDDVDRNKSVVQPAPDTTPPVTQRVALYEEDPNDPWGKRFAGTVVWRTEPVSSGPGQQSDIAVSADVEIPERHISMTWSLRRNLDRSLPASHTVEIWFKLPADFPEGGIANLPGVLMKQAEQSRGTRLAGLAVRVTNGFFLVGLSNVESERLQNLQLLKERGWFDIPLYYTSNRRAIIAIEKGPSGEQAFADAFAAWQQ